MNPALLQGSGIGRDDLSANYEYFKISPALLQGLVLRCTYLAYENIFNVPCIIAIIPMA